MKEKLTAGSDDKKKTQITNPKTLVRIQAGLRCFFFFFFFRLIQLSILPPLSVKSVV